MRPVFSVAFVSPSCTTRTVCLSISLSNGPAMAQSCGTRTASHAASSNAAASAPGAAPRWKRQPARSGASPAPAPRARRPSREQETDIRDIVAFMPRL